MIITNERKKDDLALGIMAHGWCRETESSLTARPVISEEWILQLRSFLSEWFAKKRKQELSESSLQRIGFMRKFNENFVYGLGKRLRLQ